MSEWQTIDSAPKDGRTLRISWFYGDLLQEWFTMRWDENAENGLFPGVKGMWATMDGSMTWNGTPDQFGPTHWSEIE